MNDTDSANCNVRGNDHSHLVLYAISWHGLTILWRLMG